MSQPRPAAVVLWLSIMITRQWGVLRIAGSALLRSKRGAFMTDTADPRLDVFTPETLQDPHGLYRTVRQEAPAHLVLLPHGMKAWLVTRHADVHSALTDPRLRKNVRSVLEQNSVDEHAPEGFVDELSHNLLSADPP